MPRFLRTEDVFVKSIQTQHTWDGGHEKLRVLAIFFRWMVEDSSKLVDDMVSKVKEIVMLPEFYLSLQYIDLQRRHTKADACPLGVRSNTSFI